MRNKTDIAIRPVRREGRAFRRAVVCLPKWAPPRGVMSCVLGACLCVILLPLTAVAQPAPDLGADEQREAGRLLYMDKCAQCHAETGRGDGMAAPFMRPMPRDFTAGVYKVRTTPSGQLPTDDDIAGVIRNGMPYTGMPAWPQLSDNEIRNLVYYIKTFNDDFSGPYGVPDVVEIPDPPSFSESSVERGRVVYEENQCFDCHGMAARGDGPSALTLQEQWGNHIRPADLTKRWTFIGGNTRQDIYRTFTTGLDGSPMPSYSITPIEDSWALVDYVYSLSQDDPDYATAATAQYANDPVDPMQGRAAFGEERGAYLPVVGQLIEPGRSFMPGVDGIEVKARYNADEIAILLSWHDMSAEALGSNAPDMEVPPTEQVVRDTVTGAWSDAVAVQFPQELAPEGLPYFLFGDAKQPVDLWFADLASGEGRSYVGRGSSNLVAGETAPDVRATYEDGAWTAVFSMPRDERFAEDTFVPISFSVWDGFNDERGNRRGVTGWYYLYLEPSERPSPVMPMLRAAGLTLLVLLSIVGLVRLRHRAPVSA